MKQDGRIDPAMLGDEHLLPLLISERVCWGRRLSVAEWVRAELGLPPGPRALVMLDAVGADVMDGGMMALLYNHGHQLAVAVEAARLVGAPEYEALLLEVARLLPAAQLPEDHKERGDLVEELLDRDEALDARLDELEDRYYAIERAVGEPVDCGLRYVHEHPGEFFLTAEEAAADLDDFVERLAAAAGPVERATAADVAAGEAALGRRLPPLLARLYRDVGISGWGPGRGLLAPVDLAGVRTRYCHGVGESEFPALSRDPLPVAVGEPGEYVCVDLKQPHLSVWRLPEGDRPLRFEATTLRGWLEHWLVDGAPR